MVERLLSSREVAELLGVPARTLDAWAYKGIGPAYALIGRHRRYAPQSIEAFIAANTRIPVAEASADA